MTTTHSTTAALYTDAEARQIAQTILDQIGRMNVLAISGGRRSYLQDDEGVEVILPCGHGYEVRITYVAARDLYTVTRGYRRGLSYWIKGQMTDVSDFMLADTAYKAGMFRDDWTTAGACRVC